MQVSPINHTSFQHKIIIDIGASNPKGTAKIAAYSNAGKLILKKSANSYINDTVKGFENAEDFIKKVSAIIKRTYNQVLLKSQSGEFPLTTKDKLLAGIVVFVPGTTIAANSKNNNVAFMPNLRDKNNVALKNINFSDYEQELRTNSGKEGEIEIDEDAFNLVVTKDLGGTGVALARMLAKKDLLHDGDYIMGVMTGGGFGSVDIKVKNNTAFFETSESSSYIAGNYEIYDKIASIFSDIMGEDDSIIKFIDLIQNNNKNLRDKIQVIGKLGRQGVNVKSHIGTFCSELGRKDLFPMLSAAGDARIVEMNRLSVSLKDEDLIKQFREHAKEFNEIESIHDGKTAFELREDYFGKERLKNARIASVNEYANAISLVSINKINDCINKVYLLGPFAHGVNQYVITHSEDFEGVKDLPELIKKKIKTNIDEKHADLPSTSELYKLYDFDTICDNNINIPDNTVAGDVFLNPKFEFIPNRGSWFSIPLQNLK